MKFLMSLFLLMFVSSIAFSQTVESGDPALNESFNTLIEQVKDNPEKFIQTNMALRFNQSKEELVSLLKKDKLTVAEIFVISYFAAKDSKALKDEIKAFKDSKTLKAYLESKNIKKGTKEYKNLLKASINIHPKPFIPQVK